ncbi:putative conserved membrane protein [Synechococcus sp. A15-127]|nr:putative conserved membrane protein [Synechococcus sp. A15-127]
MRSRREPLLWLQCLALGVIPLELLLIRLLLAGADPGPVPSVERLLTWGVAVLAPTVALWRQPADWGSLLLVRVPTRGRTPDQQTLSARQGGAASTIPLIAAAVLLLPLLWWLDDSAGLISEFSPLNGSSRLLCLLLSMPLLATIVWQLQQLVQAVLLLLTEAGETAAYSAEQLNSERSSFGLQLLQLASLDWPEAAPKPTATPEPTPEPEPEPEPASVPGAAAVEPEQGGEEDKGPALDADISEIDSTAGRETEEHGEETEPGRGEESEPEGTPEPTPGGL